jgi:hypothetical protein
MISPCESNQTSRQTFWWIYHPFILIYFLNLLAKTADDMKTAKVTDLYG